MSAAADELKESAPAPSEPASTENDAAVQDKIIRQIEVSPAHYVRGNGHHVHPHPTLSSISGTETFQKTSFYSRRRLPTLRAVSNEYNYVQSLFNVVLTMY